MVFWVSAVAWMRADVDNLLAACVGDALVSKSHDPEKDQSDPNKRYRIDAAYKFLSSRNAEMPTKFSVPERD